MPVKRLVRPGTKGEEELIDSDTEVVTVGEDNKVSTTDDTCLIAALYIIYIICY